MLGATHNLNGMVSKDKQRRRTAVKEMALLAAGGALIGAANSWMHRRKVSAARVDMENAISMSPENQANGYRLAEVIRRHPKVVWDRGYLLSVTKREDHGYVERALDANENAREHSKTRGRTGNVLSVLEFF